MKEDVRCSKEGKIRKKGKQKIWNASRICVSSLRRGHANLLCIVPILVYVQPKLYNTNMVDFVIYTTAVASGGSDDKTFYIFVFRADRVKRLHEFG